MTGNEQALLNEVRAAGGRVRLNYVAEQPGCNPGAVLAAAQSLRNRGLLRSPTETVALDDVVEADPRRCRVCGCTDTDCSGCIERTGESCWWVEEDLCSACRPTRGRSVLASVIGAVLLMDVLGRDNAKFFQVHALGGEEG